MTINVFEHMTAAVQALSCACPAGRVTGVAGQTVEVSGLPGRTRLGDRVRLRSQNQMLDGEIIRLGAHGDQVMVEGTAEGVAIGAAVQKTPPLHFAPHVGWIGRIIDPDGRPLDGKPLLPGLTHTGLQRNPPSPHLRKPLGQRMETGLSALNTFLPLVQGQRVGLFAGSGVGKSTLLSQLARFVDADVIVIALVGERGREVRHFTEDVLGPDGMKHAVVVAATSDRAPQVRRRCAWAATAVAEHFRDQGLQVLLLCDSITRFCEAHREVALAAGESAQLRGFPASTNGAVAALCERAGAGVAGGGDITAVYTVLVAGSDMEEPIADMLRGILDGHIVLERKIAEQGRFPAIDVLRSVSRSLPAAASDLENRLLAQARQHLGVYDRAALMVQAGLYEAGTDPAIDAAIACKQSLERFLTLADGRPAQAHYAALKQALLHGTEVPNPG